MPKYRITGPDGATYEVDAPNDDALNAAISQLFGGVSAPEASDAPAAPAPIQSNHPSMAPETVPGAARPMASAPAAPADDGLLDAIFRPVNSVVSGANEGLANILGMPVDLINNAPRVLNVLPGVDNVGPIAERPFLGSEHIKNTLSSLGMIAPEQSGERSILRRVGQEVGAMAVPFAGTATVASRLGVQGVRALPEMWRMFLEPAAVNPSRALGREVSTAVGAGMGAGIANQAADPDTPTGAALDVLGALGGATATGIGASLLRSGTDIGRAVFGGGKFADEVVSDSVARKLGEAAGIRETADGEVDLTPLIESIERGQRVSGVIPGYKESTADVTRNPGLAALEYSRQSGPNAGLYTQRRAENTQAIDEALSSAAPDPNATPGQFRAALEAERDRRLTEAAARTAGARSTFEHVASSLQPVMTGEGRGAAIRSALEDASDRAKAIVDQAWEPLRQARDTTVDMRPLADAFDEIAASEPRALQDLFPKASRVPASFVQEGVDDAGRPLAQAVQEGTGEAALAEVMGIRSALTNELRRDITDQERRLINAHIDRLDEYLDANMPESLRQQYEQARAATANYHDRFTRPQTAVGQVLDKREGLPRYPDSTVAQRFVQPDEGRISDFKALIRETTVDGQLDPRVEVAIRDQVLQDVTKRGLMDKPEELQRYLDQYGTIFREFPDLKSQLGSAAALRRQFAQAEQAEQALRQQLAEGGKSNVAKYLAYADEQATRAMRNVLGSKDPKGAADELLNFVGNDPKAVEGARKAFWGVLQERARSSTRTVDGRQMWLPNALSDFLDNPANAAVAERLWRDNPEHLKRLRQIAEVLRGVDVRNSAKAPNTSGTGQSSTFSNLLTPETLQSRWYAYQSGRISGSFLLTSIASVVVRRRLLKAQEEGFQRLLDDAVMNPDTAAMLLKKYNPADRAALARKTKLWFGNEASTIMNELGRDEDDESIESIIMRQ